MAEDTTHMRLNNPIYFYAALIGNIISGEVWNRFPDFFGGVKILAIHGVTLLNRVILGREPSRCSSTVGARLFIPFNLKKSMEV